MQVAARPLSYRLLSFVSLVPLALGCGGSSSHSTPDGGSADGAVDRDANTSSLCFPSPFRCEGTRAIPCEEAAAASAKDCSLTNQVCSPNLGCSDCQPGTGSCQAGAATWCRDDGTLAHFECDPMQGLVCEPGGCLGACSLNEVHDSYIGCDYYPTITLNPVWSGFSFAIAVSNTTGSATKVTVTRGDELIVEGSVPASRVLCRRCRVPLGWSRMAHTACAAIVPSPSINSVHSSTGSTRCRSPAR
jgi:hypothetical protein